MKKYKLENIFEPELGEKFTLDIYAGYFETKGAKGCKDICDLCRFTNEDEDCRSMCCSPGARKDGQNVYFIHRYFKVKK